MKMFYKLLGKLYDSFTLNIGTCCFLFTFTIVQFLSSYNIWASSNSFLTTYISYWTSLYDSSVHSLILIYSREWIKNLHVNRLNHLQSFDEQLINVRTSVSFRKLFGKISIVKFFTVDDKRPIEGQTFRIYESRLKSIPVVKFLITTGNASKEKQSHLDVRKMTDKLYLTTNENTVVGTVIRKNHCSSKIIGVVYCAPLTVILAQCYKLLGKCAFSTYLKMLMWQS